jgi:hypothetical protein
MIDPSGDFVENEGGERRKQRELATTRCMQEAWKTVNERGCADPYADPEQHCKLLFNEFNAQLCAWEQQAAYSDGATSDGAVSNGAAGNGTTGPFTEVYGGRIECGTYNVPAMNHLRDLKDSQKPLVVVIGGKLPVLVAGMKEGNDVLSVGEQIVSWLVDQNFTTCSYSRSIIDGGHQDGSVAAEDLAGRYFHFSPQQAQSKDQEAEIFQKLLATVDAKISDSQKVVVFYVQAATASHGLPDHEANVTRMQIFLSMLDTFSRIKTSVLLVHTTTHAATPTAASFKPKDHLRKYVDYGTSKLLQTLTLLEWVMEGAEPVPGAAAAKSFFSKMRTDAVFSDAKKFSAATAPAGEDSEYDEYLEEVAEVEKLSARM